jgi:pimeloyl-ACP methyl ester carboxylesterase
VVAYGKSMGGVAALRAIAEGSVELDGVVVECPFDEFLHTVEARFRIMKLPTFPGAAMLTFWGGVQLGANAFGHNPVDYAEKVGCPLVVLSGAHDRHAPASEGQRIADSAISGEFLLFEDCGHGGYLKGQPDLYRARMGTWLDGL